MGLSQDEYAIMSATVDALLAAGFPLTVFDGEEDTVKASRDREAILNALRTTDDDYLIVEDGSKTKWVRFVYGNSGWDVINDYSTSLERILAPVNALADSLA